MAPKTKHAETDVTDDWVRITSEDGYTFLVRRPVANASGTMSDSLDTEGNYAEALARHVPIQQRAAIVDKLLDYMLFKAHYKDPAASEDVPVHELLERITPEIVLELLLGADYQNM
ncbi:hypothetical protein MIND_00950000 [Mycena indigotica]|uniref:Elongin-C n=1 Tax=Mycena indigotica TaxID=2126181 RepID=A0A8H6SD00_9AGAR|nr:uncharacterized protein MIND_00950000 [Mycena indigotica]KAF7297169.1 hypothetical protein MIND_00950000 [Mycena indigotica]